MATSRLPFLWSPFQEAEPPHSRGSSSRSVHRIPSQPGKSPHSVIKFTQGRRTRAGQAAKPRVPAAGAVRSRLRKARPEPGSQRTNRLLCASCPQGQRSLREETPTPSQAPLPCRVAWACRQRTRAQSSEALRTQQGLGTLLRPRQAEAPRQPQLPRGPGRGQHRSTQSLRLGFIFWPRGSHGGPPLGSDTIRWGL